MASDRIAVRFHTDRSDVWLPQYYLELVALATTLSNTHHCICDLCSKYEYAVHILVAYGCEINKFMTHNMLISQEDIDPAAVRRNMRFHGELNRKLWTPDNEMRLEVRVRLLRAAVAFYRFLDLPTLVVQDIILTGSNAAYNYTDLSDIDIHLVVDYDRTVCPILAPEFFGAKTLLWNQSHNAKIRGHSIEMYVEDSKKPAQSNGVFSILTGKWLNRPEQKSPAWNDGAVIAKTSHLADQIDDLLESSPTTDAIDNLLSRLKTMRQGGLSDGGEFSIENLAYKSLRALGYLDRLYDARSQVEDDAFSLD